MVARTQLCSPYEPRLLQKFTIVTGEALWCTWLLLSNLPPLLIDLFIARLRSGSDYIAPTIAKLLDAKVFSQAIGTTVKRVEVVGGQIQLANSSGRDWLKVEYPDGTVKNLFAKLNAGNIFTNITMMLTGVYKNDLNTMQKGFIDAVQPPVASPKTYCAKWSPSRFLVVMEDLTKTGMRFPSVFSEPPCSKHEAQQALTTLAKLHAHYLGRPPADVWTDRTRPCFPGFAGIYTLERCIQSIGDTITPYARRSFTTACWYMTTLRQEYSAARPLTMCHGDAHYGNMYIQPNGDVGLIDFQCVTQEHPMRDVTYFLACTYPVDRIAQDERGLLEFYLERLTYFLRQRGSAPPPPTLDECLEQQRLQIFYAMYAFIYSGGVGGGLMDMKVMGRVSIDRICQSMERIGAEDALHRLLKRRGFSAKAA
jgi:hypothetical protein